MNKCSVKIKNPCKICLQPVTNKNGLQCQGACKKWAHFACLNYTPGKIQDIKTGYIKVMCPCPGCNTTEPKEFLVNPPFTCTNQGCAANKNPQCDTPECPSNKPKPIPDAPQSILANNNSRQSEQEYESDTPSDRTLSSCALCPPYTPCPPCPPTPICPPTPPNSSPPVESAAARRKSHKSKCLTQQIPTKSSTRVFSPAESASSTQSDSCDPSPKPRQYEPPAPQSRAPQRSQTYSDSKAKSKMKINPQRSQSCSCISSDSKCKQKLSTSASDTILESNNQLLYRALEEMCKTVGQLSVQLKDIMCKIIKSLQET